MANNKETWKGSTWRQFHSVCNQSLYDCSSDVCRHFQWGTETDFCKTPNEEEKMTNIVRQVLTELSHWSMLLEVDCY